MSLRVMNHKEKEKSCRFQISLYNNILPRELVTKERLSRQYHSSSTFFYQRKRKKGSYEKKKKNLSVKEVKEKRRRN